MSFISFPLNLVIHYHVSVILSTLFSQLSYVLY
nr:MAG TPA: hypothetical protein [Caudoviricetes sp.]